MSAPHLRPLELVEILDGSFTLLRRHAGVMIATALATLLPVWLASVLWARFGSFPSDFRAATALMVVMEAVGWLAILFTWAALAHQFSRAYVGEEVDLGDGLRAAASAMGRLVGVAVVLLPSLVATGIVLLIPMYLGAGLAEDLAGGLGMTALGMVLFALAAAAWLPRIFAVVPAVVVEGLRPLAAVERSERLGAGGWRRILAVGAVAWAATLLPRMADLFMGAVLQAMEVPAQGTLAASVEVFRHVVFLACRAVTVPLVMGFFVLLYHDRRARAEQAGAEVLVEEGVPA